MKLLETLETENSTHTLIARPEAQCDGTSGSNCYMQRCPWLALAHEHEGVYTPHVCADYGT
jgi:hypothetical protein